VIKFRSNATQKPIIRSTYTDLITSVGIREKGVLVNVTLGTFEIEDKVSAETKYPKIISRRKDQLEEVGSGKYLAEITVETKPINSQSDLFVNLKMERTEIVLNVPLIQQLLAFFTIPSTVNLKVLENAAKRQIQSAAQQAVSQLRMALEAKMIFDINLMILAPTFIIPEDFTKPSDILLLDLGKLQLKSDIDRDERSKRIKNQTVEEKDFYDRFDLEMSDIQVIHTKWEHWSSDVPISVAIEKDPLKSQILEKVNIKLKFEQCITPNTQQVRKSNLHFDLQNLVC
jgi:hypothetical protein